MNLVAGSGRSAVDTVAESRDCKVALVNWVSGSDSSAEASDYVEASENWAFDSDLMIGPWDF